MPYIVLLFVLVLYETIGFFVDGVVSQMHAQIIQVAAHRAMIFLSGKPSQTLFVNEAA